MSSYRLIEDLYLAPTPAGAFFAVSDRRFDPLRALILALLREPTTPPARMEALEALIDDLEQAPTLFDLLRRAQALAWLQGHREPRRLEVSSVGGTLQALLAPLSSRGKAMLVDWNGFSLARCGLDDETAETLAAVSADLAHIQGRYADRMERQFGLPSQGWGAIDAGGNSRIGAWPLFVGEHRFMLVIVGEPRLNRPELVDLVWLLVQRYGRAAG